MPLTPQEQQELEQLQAELGPSAMPDKTIELDFSNQQVPTPARVNFERTIAMNQMAKQPPAIVYSESQDQIASNKQKIFDYLTNKGYDRDFILAAMGNMQEESGFIPSRLQGDPKNQKVIETWFKPTKAGRGTGLVQWDGPRRTALQSFAKSRGKSWDDLETQLEFLDRELKTSEKNAYEKITQGKTLEEKTELFSKLFERAGKPNLKSRISKSLKLSKEFK